MLLWADVHVRLGVCVPELLWVPGDEIQDDVRPALGAGLR
jgi:hypothetical protein